MNGETAVRVQARSLFLHDHYRIVITLLIAVCFNPSCVPVKGAMSGGGAETVGSSFSMSATANFEITGIDQP